MTALSRPLIGLLRAALETPAATIVGDISRLRDALELTLRRCLDAPEASWVELVDRGAERGGWDEWRIASLRDSTDPASDPAPEVTREALASLANEMIERGDVFEGPWEGGQRQAVVESERWKSGQVRRELIFAVERAMDHFTNQDPAGLRSSALTIDQRDPQSEMYPRLAESVRACVEDLDQLGYYRSASLARLATALDGTPFAAFVADSDR